MSDLLPIVKSLVHPFIRYNYSAQLQATDLLEEAGYDDYANLIRLSGQVVGREELYAWKKLIKKIEDELLGGFGIRIGTGIPTYYNNANYNYINFKNTRYQLKPIGFTISSTQNVFPLTNVENGVLLSIIALMAKINFIFYRMRWSQYEIDLKFYFNELNKLVARVDHWIACCSMYQEWLTKILSNLQCLVNLPNYKNTKCRLDCDMNSVIRHITRKKLLAQVKHFIRTVK